MEMQPSDANKVRASSGLFYFGTREDVRLGDHIRVKRFLRSDLEGVVCYIPGLSKRHSELEYEDIRQWAFRAEDGTVYASVYDPERVQPKRSIVLVSRGEKSESIDPNEDLK